MVKLEYTDEQSFITETIQFTDEHYGLSEQIHSLCKNEFKSKCTQMIVKDDKKSLIFAIDLSDRNKDRVSYEIGDCRYKITIEKIPNY